MNQRQQINNSDPTAKHRCWLLASCCLKRRSKTLGAKPTVPRGQKRGSINDDYAIIGIRPNRVTLGNGVYVFKNNVDPATQDHLELTVLHIVKEMELCLSPMAKFVNLETTVMNEVVSRTTLNAIDHHATAFSIGKDYHSRCHIDANMLYEADIYCPETCK
eukprot:jgi/Psemu1/3592/gm1.3592_g